MIRKWRKYRLLAKKYECSQQKCGDDCAQNDESSDEAERIRIEQCTRYRKLANRCLVAITTIVLVCIIGPHRHPKVGSILGVRKWRLWQSWMRYIGFTVLKDHGSNATSANDATTNPEFSMQTSPAIFAFIPHGIFPFGLAFSCLPQSGYENTWGPFRPVVATATKLFPLVRTLIAWMGGIDASRNAVADALRTEPRIGISPGGIAEMFESYPKPGYHPNDEAALLNDRKGMFKLAIQHGLPVVPVYTFGATKMFKRLQLPQFLETLSRLFKISLCILFGKLGLPIPFQQRLMYVIGKTIFPPLAIGEDVSTLEGEEFERKVDEMHGAFCEEITRIFERNKEHYGWGHKTLRIV